MNNEIKLNPNYWDCECDKNYIHYKNIKECKICGSASEDMPDSIQSEIDAQVQNNIVSDGINDTINISHAFDCIKAEAKEKNVLILRKLEKPRKRFDGRMASYELEYRWLSKPVLNERDESWTCVSGQVHTYWKKNEFDMDKSLFDAFNLF